MNTSLNPMGWNVYKVPSFPGDLSTSVLSHLSDEELEEVLSELKRRYANYLFKLAQLESKNKFLRANKNLNVTFKRPNKPDSIIAVISGDWTPPLELKVVVIESAGDYVENGTTIKTNSPIVTLTDLNVGNHYGLTVHVLDSTGKTFVTTSSFEYTPLDSCRMVKTEFSDTESSITVDVNNNQQTKSTIFMLKVLVDKDKIVECEWNSDDDYNIIADEFLGRNKLKPILRSGLVRLMEQQTRTATHIQQADLADLIIV